MSTMTTAPSTTAIPIAAPATRKVNSKRLRELCNRSDVAGAIRTASHYGAIVALGVAIWQVAVHFGTLWALPLMMAQGFFVAFLFMAVHETAHKTAFLNPAANVAIGHLSSFMIIMPYEHYRLFHWDHHRYTQDPARDPELLLASVPASDTSLAVAYTGILQLLTRIRTLLRRAVTGQVTSPWVPESKRGLVIGEARLYAAGYAVLLIGSVALHSTVLLWTWLVPLFLGQLLLRPYLYAEHTGCEHEHDAYTNTRTTFTNDFVRWFAWNMPFHVEHHAYPTVPFHALPKLHEEVEDHIKFRGAGYPAVTRETWSWLRRVRTGLGQGNLG